MLHRVVLGEPLDAPALLFRHGHGDPEGWSEADFEAYENIALEDHVLKEPGLVIVVDEMAALMASSIAGAARREVAEVWAA